jgi:hypothetical protein
MKAYCNLPEGMVHCLGISRRAILVLGGFLLDKNRAPRIWLKKRFKILTLGPNPKASEENSGNSMIQIHQKKTCIDKKWKNEHEKSNWSCKK